MDARESVQNTIEKYGLIVQGDHLLLGVSGGPDSLCLLYILTDLRSSMGFRLTALHLNHMLRGEEANQDARFVEEECKKLSVPLVSLSCDVRAMAAAEGLSEEDAGRRARHGALQQKAQELGAKIVLAHHRGDQAETVLLRILRGTGIHGLAAMEVRREDGLIRPLLETSREEIEEYCTKHSLNPRVDSTNGDDNYMRNKLRLHVLPLLETMNPSIAETLCRLADNAREDDSCLQELAAAALASAVLEQSKDCLVLNSRAVAALAPALQKRVLMAAFADIGLASDISAVHLNTLCRILAENKGGKVVEFHGGYKARTGGGRLVLSAPAKP